jgi:activating signal cointegrator 1
MSHQVGVFKREQLHLPQPKAGEWMVISLMQPWATALFVPGLKRVETRSWRTNYRGRLYIHASKRMPDFAREFLNEEVRSGRFGCDCKLPIGKIIGHVELVDVQPTKVLRDRLNHVELEYGDYTPGRFGWLTTDAQLFEEPIETNGSLGIWRFKVPESSHE